MTGARQIIFWEGLIIAVDPWNGLWRLKRISQISDGDTYEWVKFDPGPDCRL